jgi:hypothetical protein
MTYDKLLRPSRSHEAAFSVACVIVPQLLLLLLFAAGQGAACHKQLTAAGT